MNTRVYYGEYSLSHWIELVLTQNIILPEYQRSFVWFPKDVKRLVKSFKEHLFVQPVTIAVMPENEQSSSNLILDGQQRITSLILAKLGYFPDREKFEAVEDIDNGDDEADEPVENAVVPIKWTFKELLSANPRENTIEAIKLKLAADDRYIALDLDDINDSFYDTTFLGFSYVVPESNDISEIQNSYSQIFRNINYLGKSLSVLESRRSLYFMNVQYQKFFEGWCDDGSDVLCDIKLYEKMKLTKIDFVRYLACLSQYSIHENKNEVMKWYSSYSSRESFHADYVSYLMGLDQESNGNKFNEFSMNTAFPGNCWAQRFEILKAAVAELKANMGLNDKNAFTSWIDADYWLFGLIYQIVFKGKTLVADKAALITSMGREIRSKKRDAVYSKSPNRLGNLRERMERSIKLIGRYVQ